VVNNKYKIRSLFLILLVCIVSSTTIVAQNSDSVPKTYEVVSADGTRKTVTAEDANAGLTDRLREMREKKEQEREDKQNKKYTLKAISRIGISILIVLAGLFITFLRKRKNKTN